MKSESLYGVKDYQPSFISVNITVRTIIKINTGQFFDANLEFARKLLRFFVQVILKMHTAKQVTTSTK